MVGRRREAQASASPGVVAEDWAPDGTRSARPSLAQSSPSLFDQGLIFVRSGKGDNDRSTLLPACGRDDLRAHLRGAAALHQADRRAGLPGVWMPDALERKYPNAGRKPGWFWAFPSRTLSTDPRAGVVRRHHVHESAIQKAVRAAATDAGISKPVSVHTLRHCFATHLLLNGVDIGKSRSTSATPTSKRR